MTAHKALKAKHDQADWLKKDSDPVQTLKQLLLCPRGCSEPLGIHEQIFLSGQKHLLHAAPAQRQHKLSTCLV